MECHPVEASTGGVTARAAPAGPRMPREECRSLARDLPRASARLGARPSHHLRSSHAVGERMHAAGERMHAAGARTG